MIMSIIHEWSRSQIWSFDSSELHLNPDFFKAISFYFKQRTHEIFIFTWGLKTFNILINEYLELINMSTFLKQAAFLYSPFRCWSLDRLASQSTLKAFSYLNWKDFHDLIDINILPFFESSKRLVINAYLAL